MYMCSMKSTFIDAIHEELHSSTINRCNIPSKDEILSSTKSNPLDWGAYDNFVQSPVQSIPSLEEQKLAIKKCCQKIDKHYNLSCQHALTKNIGIRGFPGSGKTWCSLCVSLHALSKVLFVLPTALLAKRETKLGRRHCHKLCLIPIEKNMSVRKRDEPALIQITRDEKTIFLH